MPRMEWRESLSNPGFIIYNSMCIIIAPGVALCVCVCSCSKVPAFLNVVDIAGLVKGAHAGQGLGNAFLSHISACDGIFHMTRESTVLRERFSHT